jgi:antitoxin CcdA
MSKEGTAKKRAVNLLVDSELLDEARRMHIDISETLEHRLRVMLQGHQEDRWLEENRAAIASINSFVERRGLLSSRLRYRPEKK